MRTEKTAFVSPMILPHESRGEDVIKKDDIVGVLGSSMEYWRKFARIEEGGDWYIDLFDERDIHELNAKQDLRTTSSNLLN